MEPAVAGAISLAIMASCPYPDETGAGAPSGARVFVTPIRVRHVCKQTTASGSTGADWKQNLTIAHSTCSRQTIDSDCNRKRARRGGSTRLRLLSVFYLKCDFRLPKTLHQETETARAHTVRLAARPPQKHREPQTCTRARKVRRSKRPRNAKPEETEARIKGPRQPKSKTPEQHGRPQFHAA